MNVPDDLLFTKDHEWVRIEGNTATIGISDHAQSELGEVVFVELPDVGSDISVSDSICVVESTKAASDVYAPLSGKVVESNSALADSPEKVNQDPYGEGWMIKIELSDEGQKSNLLTPETYKGIL
jgi:glycine cleavage system H protein